MLHRQKCLKYKIKILHKFNEIMTCKNNIILGPITLLFFSLNQCWLRSYQNTNCCEQYL